jgi:UDP-3-O-[3-hydroxymyristoyl] glucosamine N-acyltransferase
MPTLKEIGALLNCTVPSHAANLSITGIATLPEATETDVSFLGEERYLPQFVASKAAAFIVHKRVKIPTTVQKPTLIVDDADLAMATIAQLFASPVPRPPVGIDRAAHVAATAQIGGQVAIGPNVCVSAAAKIGARTVLHANVYVGADTILGEDCELFPNVVVRERCTIGNRVVIHACSAIGSDGFGYRWDGKKHAKIPQIGVVIIEDDVEIGSCSCVDRAKFGATRIGRGTKIDNLVQIAHNSTLGPHCILVGQSGTAGSVSLGSGVVVGGQTAIKDHVHMGDRSMVGACSGVLDDVEPGQVVSGVPAIPHRQNLRESAALRKLPELRAQVRKLQEELESLKQQLRAE